MNTGISVTPSSLSPSLHLRPPFFAAATRANWAEAKESIRGRILPFLGEPHSLDPNFRVSSVEILSQSEHPDGRLTKVRYEAEPGESVCAYLLIPHGITTPAPAVLCLHSSTALAKESQIEEIPESPGRDFGAQLARLGFVTFSPDHLAAGERRRPGQENLDTVPFYERHPDWSEAGKMIWDAARATEAMGFFPEIDSSRLGVVGHSLGGYGAFIAAAFEERLRVVACSCGMTTWEGNEKRFKWAREEWYRHFPKLRPSFVASEIPFELYELAALVAPRPFLNLSGMTDPTYGNNETLPEVGRRLSHLYEKIGCPEAFANFLFGGGHDVPTYNRDLIGGWFKRWL